MSTLAPATIASMEALLKEHYLDPDVIRSVQVEAGPLAMEFLDRAVLGAGGKYIPIPVIVGSGGGVGSSLQACFASTQPSNSVVFELMRATVFAVGEIGSEALLASEGSDDAFIQSIVLEVDQKRRRLMQLLAFYIMGDGTGTLAQISTSQTVSSTTLTLADAPTAVRFQIGDVIQISATVGGAVKSSSSGGSAPTLTSPGGSSYAGCAYVVGVNIVGSNAGTLQLSATPGGAPTALNTLWSGTGGTIVAAGDFIYLCGDAGAPSNSGGLGNAIMSGVMAWCPLGGPQSGDSFFTINRQNNTFLYGPVIDGTSNTGGLNLGSIREALTQAVAQLHQVSGRPTLIVLHPLAFYSLSLSLQSQGMYPGRSGEGPSDTGSFGFSELELPTPHGTIRVVSDPQCCPFLYGPSGTISPANGYSGSYTAFVLEEDSWQLLGVAPGEQVPSLERRGGPDGNALMQLQGTDDFFFTLKSYINLASHAPGHNAVVLLPNS